MILMVIFDRKTLLNREVIGKLVISSPDLPKTDIKVKKDYANVLQHSRFIRQSILVLSTYEYYMKCGLLS